MKITIEVTPQDIFNADTESARNPISLAIEKYLKPNINTYVRFCILWTCDINGRNLTMTSNLPLEVSHFLDRFYTNKIVYPFSFEADIPDNLLK